MVDFVLKVGVFKRIKDNEEVEIWSDEYGVNEKDAEGLISWIKALFGSWFWS